MEFNYLKRLIKNIYHLVVAVLCLAAVTSCTGAGGGVGPMGGASGGISGLNPPGGPPQIGGGPSPANLPPPEGGANQATGDDGSGGGTAVQPLGSGVVAPSTDVAHDNDPKASIESVSICSFEDKVKIHIVGTAISGFHGIPVVADYYEDGRVLRIVDKLGREYIDTKIKSTPIAAQDGRIVSFGQKGIFDVTLILDHLPVEMLHDNIAATTLWFHMTDEGYNPPVLDQMQSCPTEGHCVPSGSTTLESPYASGYVVDAAKSFSSCFQLLQAVPAVHLQ